MENSLAVIQPVDREDQLAVAELFPCLRDQRLRSGVRGDAVEGGVVDAHRQRVDADAAVADLRLVEPEIDVQHPFRRTDEVAHVVVGVECDQIGSQHAPQDLRPFGQDAEEFVRREGDVVEITDAQRGTMFAQQSGQQHELVVLHPDDVVGFDPAENLFAEERVDFPVGLPEILAVAGEREEIVAQRPDRAVAVPFVVVRDLFRREENGVEVHFRQFFADAPPVFVGLYVDSRPADPMFFVTGVQGMETGRPDRLRCG